MKEFFKPTASKVMVTLVLLGVIIFLFVFGSYGCELSVYKYKALNGSHNLPQTTSCSPISSALLIFFLPAYIHFSNPLLLYLDIQWVSTFIWIIGFSYLVSCSCVLTWRKISHHATPHRTD